MGEDLIRRYTAKQFEILERLYGLYQSVTKRGAEEDSWHCSKGCAACCTCNVTLTSLEVAYLLTHLTPDQREKIQTQIKENQAPVRYRPKVSTNGLAALCMADQEIPEEENDPDWGHCPILRGDYLCPIYDYRPFGCRALLSEIPCAEKGFAQVSPEVLTINNLFMQYIEHLDAEGVSGNFSDMILYSSHPWDSNDQERCREDTVEAGMAQHLIQNRSIPALMVPPEDADIIRPILQKITKAWKES